MASEFIPVAMAQLWQVSALIVMVAVVNRWLSRNRPHLAHVLWLVVLVKCVTPPLWSSDTGIFCWLQPEQRIEQIPTEPGWETVAWEELLVADASLSALAPIVDPSGPSNQSVSQPLAETEADRLLNPLNQRSNATTDWPGRLWTLWLGSVGLAGLIVTVRWWRFSRRINTAARRDCPELDRAVAELARQLGVKRVRLLVTESRIGPAVVGVFRKTILLPAVVVDRLASRRQVSPRHSQAPTESRFPHSSSLHHSEPTTDDVRVSEKLGYGCCSDALTPILAHELLHVRRGDLWAGLLQTLAQTVWWFHPLVWWAGKAASREAERCCDEEVLAELKCDPATYARSLLDVLELKNQLAPVPVFPGVKPVDVTSKRLERIMTLGQGCRRRTPWWCWLIAIVAAAATLPGAAFVVRGQEETQDLKRAEPVPAPLPALQSNGQPGPPQPVPMPSVTARSVKNSDREPALATVAYDLAEFAHLFSDTKAERREKFERLAQSRDEAQSATVAWSGDKPVVRATPSTHEAIRECLALLDKSGATAQHMDQFLSSVTRDPQAGLVVTLQLVRMNSAAHSEIEAAIAGIAGKQNKAMPWVIPAEKWDALHEDAPHDNAYHFVSPRLAVFNGRTVHVESVVQHPPLTVRTDSPYRTHGGLVDGANSNWVGWKALALPFQQDDGSYWLGMTFDANSLAEAADSSSSDGRPAAKTTQHEFAFNTALRDGQVVVLPGFHTNCGGTFDEDSATFLTARIHKLDPTPSPAAQPSPQKVVGVGVNSDAGVTVEWIPQPSPVARPVTGVQPAGLGSEYRVLNLHDFLRLHDSGWAKVVSKPLPYFARPASGEPVTESTLPQFAFQRLTLSAEPVADSKKFVIHANHLMPGFPGHENLIGLLGNVDLQLAEAQVRVKAASATVSQPAPPFIRFELADAEMTDSSQGEDTVTKASLVSLMLNALTWEVDQIEVNRTGTIVFPGPPATVVGGAPSPGGSISVRATDGSNVAFLPLRGGETGAPPPGPATAAPTKAIATATPKVSPINVERDFGRLKLTISLNPGDDQTPDRQRFALTDAAGRVVIAGTANDSRLRQTPDTESLDLTGAQLQILSTPPQSIVAKTLQLSADSNPEAARSNMLHVKATSVACELNTADRQSTLRAEQLEIELNLQNLSVEQIRAQKLESLRQAFRNEVESSQPVASTHAQKTYEKANRLTDASFNETPLSDALRTLSRQHDLNIVIDSEALKDEGITPETPVTLEVSGIMLRSVLKLILEPMNLETRIDEEGTIVVTSLIRANGGLVAQVYAVADLVVPIPNNVTVEAFLKGSRYSIRPDGSGRVPSSAETGTRQSRIDGRELVNLIQSTIEPDSWDIAGGPGRVVFHETNLSLVIRQTKQVHAEVADLLTQLRRLMDLQVAIEMQSIAVPVAFQPEWSADLQFEPLGESKTQRYTRLSREQVDQLRKGSTIEAAPKVTLFNGQICHWGFGEHDGRQPRLNLATAVYGDRKHVRLGVSVDDFQSQFAGNDSLAPIPTIPAGDAILLDLPELAEALAAGQPVTAVPVPGQPKVFRSEPSSHRFVLIQPQIVVVEEEEELLGLPTAEPLRR